MIVIADIYIVLNMCLAHIYVFWIYQLINHIAIAIIVIMEWNITSFLNVELKL